MTHSNRTHSSTFSPVTAITRLTSFEPVTNSHKPKVRSMQALATLPALFISHGAPTFALEKAPPQMRWRVLGKPTQTQSYCDYVSTLGHSNP
nr:hypothetical protein [Psychrobacter sp. PraFG1]UNK04851.1 hypothetical protein MN210_11935 [Psychrobacter sp. PraFG1]